jgi:small conductance mechanosensitive channel
MFILSALSAESISPVWRSSIELALNLILKILWAVGIILLTRLGIDVIGNFLRQVLGRTEPTLRKFLIQAAEIFTLLFGAVAAINQLGIETTSIVAVVGAAGLAIGLALQNTLSHFAAGVMLISLRPFEVGDHIEGAGVSGIVDSIGIFSTTLITEDNVKITVPNGQLFSGTLKNTTALGTRRVDLKIDIGDRPIESTIVRLLAIVQPHPLILDQPQTTCHVLSMSAIRTVLYLRPWCKAENYDRVRSEVLQTVKEALREIPSVENTVKLAPDIN